MKGKSKEKKLAILVVSCWLMNAEMRKLFIHNALYWQLKKF